MKSDDITIQQLFQDRRQYMVPFYQRTYVWTRSNQWDQLWEDILGKAEAILSENQTTPHFLGAIVLDPQPKSGLIGVDTLHIIDGQQRLTTLQFILKSVLLALKDVDTTAVTEIILGTLKNPNPDTMHNPSIEVFKVWPTFRDRKHYQKAFGVEQLDELRTAFPANFTQHGTLRKIGMRHPPPLEAIWFFTKRFEKWIREAGEDKIKTRSQALATSILRDLKVVSIVLDEKDDAQVIFETLNGRGAQLHATDLIRNFIFMRADREGSNSEKLYNELWENFEDEYWNSMQHRGRLKKPRIEWFIHSYLQAIMCEEIDLGRLYFEYRRYVFDGNKPKSASLQLHSLVDYSSTYRKLVDGKGSDPIAIFGRRIAPYEVTTLYPLALLIGASDLSDEKKNGMFGILLSYVVRRAICGLTQKNYNNVFISILRKLSDSELSTAALYNHLLSLKWEGSRWPRDEEFMKACMSSKIYPGQLDSRKMRAILLELEYELRENAKVEDASLADTGHLDIDHILPQSWFTHWALPNGDFAKKSEIDEISMKQLFETPLNDREQAIAFREKLVNTLGNLTLLNLSVNREAQHKGFSTKKKLLIKNTTLRLNVPLLGLETWNEDGIKERSELLAKAALRIWSGEKAVQGD